MKFTVATILIAMLICSCGRKENKAAWEDQSPKQHLAQWRQSAKFEMLKECTNSVTGISGITTSAIVSSPDNVAQWTGSATVEFTNPAGGIDHTDLFFTFSPDKDEVTCLRDHQKEYDTELARKRVK